MKLEESRSRVQTVVETIKAHVPFIAFIGVIAILAVLWLGVDLSREMRLIILAIAATLPIGWIVGGYVIDLLHDPTMVYLVDFDAQRTDGALHQFTVSDFNRLDVTDGHLSQLSPQLYIGKHYDSSAKTVQGTWHGTLDDRELARTLDNVRRCREVLEQDARRGFAIESGAHRLVEKAARDAVRAHVKMVQDATLPDRGEGIEKAIEETVDSLDLDKHLDDIIEKYEPENIDNEDYIENNEKQGIEN